MCILAVKKTGVRKPTTEEITNMSLNNPDGFGIAYVVNGELVVKKTFDVNDIIKINDEVITEDTPAIYHFRIATHGSVKQDNCHPFLDDNVGVAFAHNGILGIKNEKDMTDSETAFRRIFIPVIKSRGYDSDDLELAVDSVIGTSKFAFINKDGEIRHFGHFNNDKGMLFSNYTYSYSGHYGFYGAGNRSCASSATYERDWDCIDDYDDYDDYYYPYYGSGRRENYVTMNSIENAFIDIVEYMEADTYNKLYNEIEEYISIIAEEPNKFHHMGQLMMNTVTEMHDELSVAYKISWADVYKMFKEYLLKEWQH